jgi:hypothetical protein
MGQPGRSAALCQDGTLLAPAQPPKRMRANPARACQQPVWQFAGEKRSATIADYFPTALEYGMTAAARRLTAYVRHQCIRSGCFGTAYYLAGSPLRSNECMAIDLCSCYVLIADRRKPLWYDPKTDPPKLAEPSSPPVHFRGRRPQRWKLRTRPSDPDRYPQLRGTETGNREYLWHKPHGVG